MTLSQAHVVVAGLSPDLPGYAPVFAGRIAHTGRDPVPMMAAGAEQLKIAPASELIWASPHKLSNVFQTDNIGFQVINVTNDVLSKLSLAGLYLDIFSLDALMANISNYFPRSFPHENQHRYSFL